MKMMALCLATVLASTMAQAKALTVTVDGKDVTVESRPLHHRITESDRAKGSQSTAMTCSFLYYALLAGGDVDGAAKLSTDPATTLGTWTAYVERVGAEFFRKSMNDYFASNNVILAEIVYGEDTMLILETEDGVMAQFYRKTGGKYLVSARPTAVKTLGKVLNMVKEGTFKP